MKWMETVPFVLIAVVAAAALAFDDRPDYQGAPRLEKPAVKGVVKAVPVEKSLLPNESLVIEDHLEFPRKAPARTAAAPASPRATPVPPPPREVVVQKGETPRSRVEVEARRLTADQRLQHAVMAAIRSQGNLSGQIAVETRDAVVWLSGWTLTPGQSLRAEKSAARVSGVRRVVNEIRPRMGAIT